MANLQIVPACRNNVEAQFVEMMVPLYSYGCEKKVKKTLSHLKGIYSVNVDYNQQKVTVWGICNKYDVLDSMRSKRKEARFWNPQDNIALGEPLQSPSPIISSPPNPKNYSISNSKPSLALTKFRSFTWKAMKKAFTRSHSL
ncbi:hypothetical protein L484_002602 [Morus notabilis]|uniref:HMA domain-containing protein n=1 Tax=Morus notabilis TaxID=981085 RepID=W9RT45_9ROSA|nr:protein SODIUM POTASSIUM ROOT DEFECTIVE 2 [Morus notabilis]EXB94715.1 hypothetical protein L484_002602 [Morus notabilis]